MRQVSVSIQVMSGGGGGGGGGGADVPLPLPLQKQKNSGQSSLEDIYNLVLPNNLEIMQLINATPTTTPNLIKCFLKAAW